MKDETKSKLDAIFDRHEASKRAAAQAKQVVESKEEAFVRAFNEASDKIIRPALEEVGKHAKARGISYEISNEEDKLPTGREPGRSASIAITFFPGEKKYPPTEFPALTVFCEKHKQRVRFHERTMMPGRGGHAGPTGEADLPQITADLIQQKILDVLSQAFR